MTSVPVRARASEPPIETGSRVGRMWRAYSELTKLRLTAMVVVTAAVGYLLGSHGAVDWRVLLCAMLGTFLAGASASAFNQSIETKLDARMDRTRDRPLPAGRLTTIHATWFAVASGVVGIVLLATQVNLLTAGLGLFNIIVYVLIYTPLKTKSSLNTVVGAVCGAVPPMMGFAAATDHLGVGAWLLGALLFIWQIPHFLALAWMYRDDYARGGFRMLPVTDREGRLTCTMIVLYSLALIPSGLALYVYGISGPTYGLGSLLLGAVMVGLALQMARSKTRVAARRLFLASVIYLPLLLLLMVADMPSGVRSNGVAVRPAGTHIEKALFQ